MKTVSLPIVLSYLAIYIVWGSTYFFIKMAVATMPPYYLVGLRFFFRRAGVSDYCRYNREA
ncbi:MAG TPA: hypothetical protein VF335_08910 [Chitinivibrionales bacterium]